LIIKKGTFSKYELNIEKNEYSMLRETALENVLDNINDNDFVVSTTGKTSRELFELREKLKLGHSNDFLTVGSMGHTSSIALGISLNTDKNIYCIDGDGAFLMHMGGLAVLAQNANNNLKYILINNGVHESVGGQPTVALEINVKEILQAVGFKNIYIAQTADEINNGMRNLKENKELSALIIYTKQGSRDDLGRPTTTPIENKLQFMKKLEEI